MFTLSLLLPWARRNLAMLLIGALILSVVSVVGFAYRAQALTAPPTWIELSSDSATFLAGQTALLTATTDVAVEGSESVIQIVDTTTSAEIATCSAGTQCAADVAFDSGGPHQYVAHVGSLSSSTVQVSRASWTIELTTDHESLDAGESATLEAVTNQDPAASNGAYAIYIFDGTNGQVLARCDEGVSCVTVVPTLYDNDDYGRTYHAAVGAMGSPATIDEVEDLQARATDVSVVRAPWELTLTSSDDELGVGDSATITATANQDVDQTEGRYALYLVDVQNDGLVVACTSGHECSTTVTWADVQQGRTFVAFIAAIGLPQSVSELEDIQMGSSSVHLQQQQWQVELAADKTAIGAGDSVTVTSSTNQDLAGLEGLYSVYLFESGSARLLGSCSVGTTCDAVDSLYGPDDDFYSGRYYQAVVGLTGTPLTLWDVEGTVAWSNWVSVERKAWTVDITRDDATVLAGATRLISTTDQSLDDTNGLLSIYFVDAETLDVVDRCDTGLECTADVPSGPGGRAVFAVLGQHSSATMYYEIPNAQASSGSIATVDDFYSISLEADNLVFPAGTQVTLTATTNHPLEATSGPWAILIYDVTAETLIGNCFYGTECSVATSFDSGPAHDYQAIIAESEAWSIPSAQNVQASSAVVTVERQEWEVALTANKEELVAGEAAQFTAVANQSLDLTGGQYQLAIFDVTTGTVVKSCLSGTICVWDPEMLYFSDGLHDYVAAVVGSEPTLRYEDALDTQATSDVLQLEVAPWTLSMVSDLPVFATGSQGKVTASGNQDIAATGNYLAIYYFDLSDGGKRVHECVTFASNPYVGNMCTAYVAFNTGPAHEYVSVVARKTNPATLEDAVGILATSNHTFVERAEWEAGISVNLNAGFGYTRIIAGANQNPFVGGGAFGLYLVIDDYIKTCNPYLTCDAYVMPHSGQTVTAIVASRDAPFLHDIQATSSTYYAPIIGGPQIDGETIGGGNPAEADCQCKQGDPVNTATGEFYVPESDISIPGVGPTIGVDRTYSSVNAADDGAFGFGWTASFASRIEVTTAGSSGNPLPAVVQVVQENGSTVEFTRDYFGQYRAPLRVQATLAYDTISQTWTFVRQRTQVFKYNVDGQLTEVSDLVGNTVVLSYDTAGHVVSLDASGERSVDLTWDGDHVVSVSDGAGRTVLYGYSTTGDLLTVTGVDGRVMTYGYDSAHYLTTVVSPGGAELQNTYDSEHRVISQIDAIGGITTYVYDGFNRTITSPGGAVVREVYSPTAQLVSQTLGFGTALARTSTFVYDNANNLATVTNALGEHFTRTYDANGHVVSYTDEGGGMSNWTYDSLGNATSSTDQLGRHSTATYGPQGQLLSTTSQSGNVQTWTYNSNGTVATSSDPLGAQTSYSYDLAGRLAGSTNPDGLTSTITYDARGIAVSGSNFGGAVTLLTSDAAGRILSVADPTGAITTFTYDAFGNRVSTTDAAGRTSTGTLDLLGRNVSMTDSAGGVSSYTYTAAGEVATFTDPMGRVTTYAYDILGQLTSVTDPLGRTTSYTYDAVGRTTSRQLPSGAHSSAQYDERGNLIVAIDENGDATNFLYDLAGQLIWVRDPLERTTTSVYGLDGEVLSTLLPDGSHIDYEYDPTGRVTSITNADGRVTSYAYSPGGRLTSKVEPGGLTTSYTFDAAGRTATVEQPGGSTTSFSYDLAGRPTTSHSSVAGSTDNSFVYDAAGQLIAVTDASGTSSYTYDPAGRVASEFNGAGLAVSYDYDASGLLTEVTYSSAGSVEYTYDAAGQMESVTDWLDNTTEFTWAADGQLSSRVAPNGLTESRTYSPAGETTAISVANITEILATFTYGYDDAGQIDATTTDNGGASSGAFEYDELGQLSSLSSAGDTAASSGSVVASAGGELRYLAGQTFAYNAAQQLTAGEDAAGVVTSYAYDGDGARVSAVATLPGGGTHSRAYSYDAGGNLASVTTPTTFVSYVSNAAGLRQSRTEGSKTDEFLWSTVASVPLLLSDGESCFIYGPSSAPIAEISATGEVEYLFGDLIGSTRVIADDEGEVVATSEFDAFGVRVAHTGTADSLFGYSGNWTDPDTGLVYLRARDYDPATAQFLTVDPALDLTHQPYAYVANNPLLLTDPLGLYSCDDYGKNALAFTFGVIDGLSFGTSSLLLGMLVPGYTEFTENNGWFVGGMVVGSVAPALLTGGATLAISAVALASRLAVRGATRTVLTGGEHMAVSLTSDGLTQTLGHLAGAGGREGVEGVLQNAARSADNRMGRSTFGEYDHATQAMNKYSARNPESNTYDVIGHGSPDTINGMSVAEIGPSIKSLSDGQDIRLLSCWTGAPSGTFAQGLANYLGVRVKAPTTEIGASNSGKTLTIFDGGVWKWFEPEY